MRDIKRIDNLYQRLAVIHKSVPDQRFSQFLINIFSIFKTDPFYMEDEEFISYIEKNFLIDKNKNL